jgi:uncharacterized protein
MMSSERRFVLDTNIIVSAAFFPKSIPCQAMDWVIQEGKILTSASVFAELTEVLLRPRFDRYATLETRIAFLDRFVSYADFIEISETIVVCRDPKDDQYLSLAVSGKAACIVTGDEDLLVLHPFRLIPILTARTFLEYYIT